MSATSADTLVIGAGLAGLAAAVRLHEAGLEVLVVDASDTVGGRVRTDAIDGFLIDRGFQVYLDAYPESGALLDLPALDLRPFEPGALVWKGERLHPLVDVFRRPGELVPTAFSPIGTPLDKLRVARLRSRLLRKKPEAIWSAPNLATIDYLRHERFSDGMIDGFFRGFYGGVFLEDSLATSSRLFEFTFALFARGSATLPAAGMGAIPKQLAARLPEGSFRLDLPVTALEGRTVTTPEGKIRAKRVVLATDGSTAARLLPNRQPPCWNRTASLSFSAPEPPFQDKLIALRGDRRGPVHLVCVPSQIAETYSPRGRSLVTATVIGSHAEGSDAELVRSVRADLLNWFGPVPSTWELLALHRIERALPIDPPGHFPHPAQGGPVFVCGDHTESASIEGAIRSGLRVAAEILRKVEI